MVQVQEKRPVEMDPAYDAPILASYRPFSRAAIFAVPLALASTLALISPVLWIVPIVAVLFSAIALRATCFGEQPLLGKKAAIVGLILSCFLLGYAPAQYLTSRSILCGQAASYANKWLDLVQSGRLAEAHQLHLMYYERVAPNTDLEKYYDKRFPDSDSLMRKQMQVTDPYSDLKDYFKTAPLKDIVEAAKNGQYQLEDASVLDDEEKSTLIELHYRYTFLKQGNKTIPVQIRMRRALLPTGSKHWNVESITSSGSPPPALKRPGS
jgi:hypothetical protein